MVRVYRDNIAIFLPSLLLLIRCLPDLAFRSVTRFNVLTIASAKQALNTTLLIADVITS